jgi:DNA-binding GntR family transcriptional regulator
VDALMVRLSRDRAAGKLADSLSEAELQRHTGAARGDLARALRRLEELGIVARNRGHGWRFAPGLATPAERDAAYRFRIAVEPAALLEPGYALPHGFAAEMRQGHRDFLDTRWHDSRAVAFFELNAAFHHGIVAASGNRFFLAATEQHNRLRRLLNYGWVLGAARGAAECDGAPGDPRCAGGRATHAAASRQLREHLQAAQALTDELARLRGVA